MSVDCVILAAGQSARFGKVKALAEFQGKTLLDHALSAAQLRYWVLIKALLKTVYSQIDTI